MKIKNIAAICKKNKYAVIYERNTESGGVVQYIGDGAAAYPVTGLPALDKESLLTIFDVPEKQREDWFVQVAGIPSEISFDDMDATEKPVEREAISIAYSGKTLKPLQTRRGLVFIESRYLSARFRYSGRAGAIRADHARRDTVHCGEGGLPASSGDYAV